MLGRFPQHGHKVGAFPLLHGTTNVAARRVGIDEFSAVGIKNGHPRNAALRIPTKPRCDFHSVVHFVDIDLDHHVIDRKKFVL